MFRFAMTQIYTGLFKETVTIRDKAPLTRDYGLETRLQKVTRIQFNASARYLDILIHSVAVVVEKYHSPMSQEVYTPW